MQACTTAIQYNYVSFCFAWTLIIPSLSWLCNCSNVNLINGFVFVHCKVVDCACSIYIQVNQSKLFKERPLNRTDEFECERFVRFAHTVSKYIDWSWFFMYIIEKRFIQHDLNRLLCTIRINQSFNNKKSRTDIACRLLDAKPLCQNNFLCLFVCVWYQRLDTTVL